jgi:hypothetical protein
MLSPSMARFIGGLDVWLQVELTRAHKAAAGLSHRPRRLLLGCVVWGRYVERFLSLGVRSLLASGNLGDLFERPLLVIHTDHESESRLAVGLTALRAVADVDIHVIPQPLVGRLPDHPQNKYWLISAAHHAHIHEARFRGCGYHLLMPDHVYAQGYFAGLHRLACGGRRAIVQANISGRLEDVGPRLEARGCALPPAELYSLALDHLHPQAEPTLVDGTGWPGGQLFALMRGEHEARIVSPYMAISYLAPEVVARARLDRLYSTIDGLLPHFIPDDVEPYCPAPEDGVGYIELSDTAKGVNRAPQVSLEAWCASFWGGVRHDRGHERFLGLTTRCPLARPYPGGLSAERMDALAHELRAAVAASYRPPQTEAA